MSEPTAAPIPFEQASNGVLVAQLKLLAALVKTIADTNFATKQIVMTSDTSFGNVYIGIMIIRVTEFDPKNAMLRPGVYIRLTMEDTFTPSRRFSFNGDWVVGVTDPFFTWRAPLECEIGVINNFVNAAISEITTITSAAALPGTPNTVALPAAPAAPTTYSISPTFDALAIGVTQTLTISPSPAYPINWQSSNIYVATVDANGVVTTVGKGTANITAGPFTDGARPYLTSTIDVADPAVYTITPAYVNMPIGAIYGVPLLPIPAVLPTWTSADPSIASVNTLGQITALVPGQTTVSSSLGPVQNVNVLPIIPTSVMLPFMTPAVSVVTAGQTLQMFLNGKFPTNTIFTWLTSDAAKATVSPSGLVTGVAPGLVTITAVNQTHGIVITNTVLILSAAAAGLSFAVPSLLMVAGETYPVSIVGTIAGGTTIQWITSNPNIATIDSSGVITAVADGNCSFAALLTGGTTGSVLGQLGVYAVNQQYLLDLVSYEVPVGQAFQLALAPIPPTGTEVTWTSSNPAVAAIDANGLVFGMAEGNTELTVNFVAGPLTGQHAEVLVTVTPATSNLTMGFASSYGVVVDGSTATYPVVIANGPVSPVYAWSTDNTDVATVNASTGLVTGVAVGNLTLVAELAGYPNAAFLPLTVIQGPSGTYSYSDGTDIYLMPGQSHPLVFSPVLGVGATVAWYTSNDSVADVTAGIVTAGAGSGSPTSAVIYADIGNVLGSGSAAITAHVIPSGTVWSLVGHSVSIGASVPAVWSSYLPTDTTIAWTVNNPAIGTVDGSGNVTGVSAGLVVLTATITGGPLQGQVYQGNVTVS